MLSNVEGNDVKEINSERENRRSLTAAHFNFLSTRSFIRNLAKDLEVNFLNFHHSLVLKVSYKFPKIMNKISKFQ